MFTPFQLDIAFSPIKRWSLFPPAEPQFDQWNAVEVTLCLLRRGHTKHHSLLGYSLLKPSSVMEQPKCLEATVL